MDSQLVNILNDIFFEFPNDAQCAQIKSYADSMPQRLTALRQIQEIEDSVVNSTISKLKSIDPAIMNRETRFWRELPDRLALVSRVCAQAMILANPQHVGEKILQQLKFYADQCQISEGIISSCMQQLREEFSKQLSAETFQLFEPYLTLCVSNQSRPQTLAV